MSERDITVMLREWCEEDHDEPCVHCRAAAEIDRLRAIKKSDDGAYEHVVSMYHEADAQLEASEAREKAWMNGVADVVEPYGFDREAACGPADLLPGLKTLAEFAFKAIAPCPCDTPDCPAITYRCAETRP